LVFATGGTTAVVMALRELVEHDRPRFAAWQVEA
jgi:hypothetical protein